MPVKMGGHFWGSSRGERKNNVRKNGGKKVYKQYREKNDSTFW